MSVVEQPIEIEMPSGTTGGAFLYPDSGGPFPGVIHLTDAGGFRPSHVAMATKLAEKGYAVLVPNLFYRTGGKPGFRRPPEVTVEEMRKEVDVVVRAFTPEIIEADGNCYIDFLLKQDAVRKSRIGVVGYCFSGSQALCFAALRPNEVAAAASFHGGEFYTDSPDSPHHVLPQVKGRLYFGHADKDVYMPTEMIEKFDAALQAWGGDYESELYTGAYHSWTIPDSPIYNPEQAARAFAKLTALFSLTLQ
jgi:carboxymethylenebutenolidase